MVQGSVPEPGIRNESMKIEGVFVKRSEIWNAVKRELIKQSEYLEGFTVGRIRLYESMELLDRGEAITDLSEPVGEVIGKDRHNPFIVAVNWKRQRITPVPFC